MHSYRFSNLLGATYRGGSVLFTPDGNVLLSPVGNRVGAVDLIQGRCATLGPEAREDIKVLALSGDGRLLTVIDSSGRSLLVNFTRGNVLSRKNFKEPVRCARWSPNDKFIAVSHGRLLKIFRAPRMDLGWQYVDLHTVRGHHDDVTDLAWTSDSLFVATCSLDLSVRLTSVYAMEGFTQVVLVEHRSPVRGVFFSADMLHLYSLSREGVLVSLRYHLEKEETGPGANGTAGEPGDAADPGEAQGGQARKALPIYCRKGSWAIQAKAYCSQPGGQKVTRCSFDASSRLLAAGFSGGLFMLYEMPELQALQTLSLGAEALDTVALGPGGDWLAVGSGALGQLLVWEWRSETYVLKQQGHLWGVQCVAFSPSGAPLLRGRKALTTESRAEDRSSGLGGRLMATGGYDGKVKLFNAQSGLCFVTFAEHTAPVSAVCFTPQGNAVLSASSDGSVRAFDLLRYRNFRTFVSPDGLCQFSGVAVDSGGEIVAASSLGGKYAVYVWSLQTGTVLEVLTGHTSNVQCIDFSPSPTRPGMLASCSWDGNICVWDLYASANKGGAAETLRCGSGLLCVVFDPRGNDICAAACQAGQVLFWNVSTGRQSGSIDGLRDIRSGQQWRDEFSATHTRNKKAGMGLRKTFAADGINLSQHFNSLAYARSGELLLCSSKNSPKVYMYDTDSHMLAARFTLTENLSLSGVQVMLHHNDKSEFGTHWDQFDLSDSDADDVDLVRRQMARRKARTLPGVTVGEAKDAYTERELHVWSVAMSADSQQFAVATTHGVYIFSADVGAGVPGASAGLFGSAVDRFVPQMLTKNVSAPAVLKALEGGDISRAMILALALNDFALLRKVYERVPVAAIPVVVASIGSPLLPALLSFLSQELRPVSGTPHFYFHLQWITALLDVHFLTLLEVSSGKASARTGTALELGAAARADVAALCLQLLVELSQRHAAMSKVFDGNTYLLRYLSNAPGSQAEAQGSEAVLEEALRPWNMRERSSLEGQGEALLFEDEAADEPKCPKRQKKRAQENATSSLGAPATEEQGSNQPKKRRRPAATTEEGDVAVPEEGDSPGLTKLHKKKNRSNAGSVATAG